MVLLRSMIGCWQHNVVCPSVTLCIVALRVGVDGLVLYRRVPSRQLPINFFRVTLLLSFGHKKSKHTEKTNRRQFGKWTLLLACAGNKASPQRYLTAAATASIGRLLVHNLLLYLMSYAVYDRPS